MATSKEQDVNKQEINSIIQGVVEAARIVSVKRNGVERDLDIVKIQRGADKGACYYGISFAYNTETKTNNIESNIQFIGHEIVCNYVDTAFNTKMQAFNENALLAAKEKNSKTWTTLDVGAKLEAFQVELTEIVEKWSMREVAKDSILNEMKEVGERLKAITVDKRVLSNVEFANIMAEINALALKQIGM